MTVVLVTAKTLKAVRAHLGLTQSQMGEAVGLSLRQYQELEAHPELVRELHLNAIRWVAAKEGSQVAAWKNWPDPN